MNISETLSRTFSYKPEEARRLVLLLALSVFMGIFTSYYYAYSNARFLNVFDISYLPLAFFSSGVVGFVTSYIYSFMLRRLSYSKLLIGTMVSMTIFILMLRLGTTFDINERYLAFVGFIWIAPIIGLNGLVFWGITMKLFDLRQGKRLFGLIASGEVIAAVFGFFSVAFIIQIFGADNILLFALIGIGAATFMIFYISGIFSEQVNGKTTKGQIKTSAEKVSIKDIFSNKYFRSIFALSFLSMTGFVLVSFTFLTETRTFFTSAEELGKFFGFYFGVAKTIEFFAKAFISGKLLQKYGVRLGFSLLPIMIAFFTLVAFVIIMLNGFNLNEKNYFLFIALAMNMLFYVVIKRSLEDPSFKMLFQPLKGIQKVSIQALAEGKARQIGAISTGLVLIILNYFLDTDARNIGVILLMIVSIFWINGSDVISKAYRTFLKGKLNENRSSIVGSIYQYSILNRLYYIMYKAVENAKSKEALVIKNILPNIHWVFGAQRSNIRGNAYSTIDSNKELHDRIEEMKADWNNDHYGELISMVVESDSNDLAYVMIELGHKFKERSFHSYLDTLEDLHLNRRMATILLLSNYRGKLLQNVFRRLMVEDHSRENLQSEFIYLIELMGNTHNNLYRDNLFELLQKGNIEIQMYSLKALLNSDFDLNEESRLIIKNMIIEEVQYYNWILASLLDLRNTNGVKSIVDLMNRELHLVRDMTIDLLALIYDKNEVAKIKYVLEKDMLEEVVLAIEMLDILVEKDIKEYLFPIVDGQSKLEKFQRLDKIVPQRRMSGLERIKYIVNYDYNKVNSWIRISCIQYLSESLDEVPDELLAQIFSKDQALKESIYLSLYNNNRDLFVKYIQFEKDKSFKKNIKDLTLNRENAKRLTKVEIVNVLKQVVEFNDISESRLLKIALMCNPRLIGNIDLHNDLKKSNLYLVHEGSITFHIDGEKKSFGQHEVIGLYDNILDQTYKISTDTNFKLIEIPVDVCFDVLNVYPEFVLGLINQ